MALAMATATKSINGAGVIRSEGNKWQTQRNTDTLKCSLKYFSYLVISAHEQYHVIFLCIEKKLRAYCTI